MKDILTRLEEYKKVCRKYLILSDDTYIDVIFGAVFANRIDSKPLWLHIVGPPGSGKTEILQSLSSSEEIVCCSTLTRHSLISGWGKVPKGQGKKVKDFSLLLQLDNKVLIIKDFTTMLQMRYEELHEILGQMRSAYDGTMEKKFGNQPEISKYVAKFGVITGVTHAIEEHKALLAPLGERFLTYCMPEISDFEKMQRTLKAMSNLETEEQEAALRSAARHVLGLEPVIPKITAAQRREIAKIAQVVACARTEVIRDRRTREPGIPHTEHPTRPGKQLGDLVLGIAMARQKKAVTKAEIHLVQRIAIHSISSKRIKLFEVLLSKHAVGISAAEIAEIMNFSQQCVYWWLQDLLLLGLVKKNSELRGHKEVKKYHLVKGKMLKRIMRIKK